MISKQSNTPYSCRDPSRKHASLKSVPLAKVRELMKDPTFMACRSETIRNEIIKKVEEKKFLFGK